MMKAKIEFLWYKAGDEIKKEDASHIDAWTKLGYVEEGDADAEAPAKPTKVEGDLDGDGDFDKDDLKIAAKTLGRFRKAKKK